MTNPPASLVRHSPTWILLLIVIVIGDLAGMLATFMPMKVILILASESVPSFLPAFLVEGGTVFASIWLLLTAALLGLLAKMISVLVEHVDNASASSPGASRGKQSEWTREAVREAQKTRSFEASLVLTFPIIAVLVLVSPPYLAFSVLWLVLSAVGMIFLVRRSSGQAPYFSGVDQFSYQLADWLKTSALWSMVGLAVLTLFVAPPALGTTAILIAAIFGRRLTLAVVQFLPRLTMFFTHKASEKAQGVIGALVTNRPTATVVRWPIEYFSTPAGTRFLGNHLAQNGFARSDWRVLGPPTGPALTLLAGPNHDRQLLIRVFRVNQKEARDKEYQRRVQATTGGLYPDEQTVAGVIAGFPTIEVMLTHSSTLADLDRPVDWNGAIDFQIEREVASVEEFARHNLTSLDTLQAEELVGRLHRASRLPGPHAVLCIALAETVPEAIRLIKALPAALVPSRALGKGNLYTARDGSLRYLGGQTWSVGRMGDAWGPFAHYEKALRGRAKGKKAPVILPHLVMLNANLNNLNRALQNFELARLPQAVAAVHKSLETAKTPL